MSNAVLQRLVDEREQINRDIDHLNDQSAEDERDPSEAERQLLTRYRHRLGELEPMIVEQLDLEEQRHSSRDASAMLQRAGGRTAAQRANSPVERPAATCTARSPPMRVTCSLPAMTRSRRALAAVRAMPQQTGSNVRWSTPFPATS